MCILFYFYFDNSSYIILYYINSYILKVMCVILTH